MIHNFIKILYAGIAGLASACFLPGCGEGSDGSSSEVFLIGAGFDNDVRTIVSDDENERVYVGGFFTNYGGVDVNYFVGLNRDGTINTEFVTGSGFDDFVISGALVTDGSGDMFLGGYFSQYDGNAHSGIIKLRRNGSLAPDFDSGVGFNGGVATLAMAVDGGGDIYVGGSFTEYSGASVNRIVRLNSDGSLDLGFAIGTGFNNSVKSIVPATDGSGDVYVGGSFVEYNGATSNLIVRLNSDGSSDEGFDSGTGFHEGVSSITLAADGSSDIYVGGEFTSYNGIGANYIARLNDDGTLDQGFQTGLGLDDQIHSIVSSADGTGDIYIGGSFFNYNGNFTGHIARIGRDGFLDSNFRTGSGFNSRIYSLAASGRNGAVYAGGKFTVYNGSARNRMVRLSSSGSLE